MKVILIIQEKCAWVHNLEWSNDGNNSQQNYADCNFVHHWSRIKYNGTTSTSDDGHDDVVGQLYYLMYTLKLAVGLPMLLYYINNRGAVSWISKQLVYWRKIETRCGIKLKYYLCTLKELGYIQVLYKKGTNWIPNIGTKYITKKEHIKPNNFMYPAMKVRTKNVTKKNTSNKQVYAPSNEGQSQKHTV